MTPELQDIVERSYQVFNKYKATIPLDVCTACCLTKEQESQLVHLSVSEIPFDLLYDYNAAVIPTKPGIEEFKHFLPRFLELTAELKFLHHAPELVLAAFHHYDKKEWTREERVLIREFAHAYFTQCVITYPLPGVDCIDTIVIMLWETKIDIKPLLDNWTKLTATESVLHFKDLIITDFGNGELDELLNSLASDDLSKTVYEWMQERTTKRWYADKIEKIFGDPPDGLDEIALHELMLTYDPAWEINYFDM